MLHVVHYLLLWGWGVSLALPCPRVLVCVGVDVCVVGHSMILLTQAVTTVTPRPDHTTPNKIVVKNGRKGEGGEGGRRREEKDMMMVIIMQRTFSQHMVYIATCTHNTIHASK